MALTKSQRSTIVAEAEAMREQLVAMFAKQRVLFAELGTLPPAGPMSQPEHNVVRVYSCSAPFPETISASVESYSALECHLSPFSRGMFVHQGNLTVQTCRPLHYMQCWTHINQSLQGSATRAQELSADWTSSETPRKANFGMSKCH